MKSSPAPLPEPVIVAFNTLAYAQRRRPENAMNVVQQSLDGGLLTYLVEHVGDITNRMAKRRLYDVEAGGYEKVGHALHTLRHAGFATEERDQERRNARSLGIPLAEYTARADNALAAYAAEHRKLPVYNQAQFAAREAAVALGERRWADAITMLEYLEALITDGMWEAAVREYRLAADGSVLEYPWDTGLAPNARTHSEQAEPEETMTSDADMNDLIMLAALLRPYLTAGRRGGLYQFLMQRSPLSEARTRALLRTKTQELSTLTGYPLRYHSGTGPHTRDRPVLEVAEHKANARRSGERVAIIETYPDTGTLLPEHLRVYGVRKTVHGFPVVEVNTGWYYSPDLRVSAQRQYVSEGAAGSGWILVDERRPNDHSDYINTKPEALLEMVEWAARLRREETP